MGRHKKVKRVDPFYKEVGRNKPQKNSRLIKLEKKNVDNLRPKNLDEQQQVSQRFKLFIEKMNAAKKSQPTGKKNKNKFHNVSLNSHLKPQDRGEPAVKPMKFEKKPWESEERFVSRMNKATRQIMEEIEMVAKLQEGAEPIDDPKEEKQKKEGSNKKKERLIKKKEKKKMKKQQIVEEILEKEKFKDHVKFGEVAMQPPDLKAKPRKSTDSTKPGQKSLILKTMLENKSKSLPDKSQKKKISVKGLGVTKTKKRKHMSVAEKRQFDKAQTLAIQGYRQAKAEKRKENQMNNAAVSLED